MRWSTTLIGSVLVILGLAAPARADGNPQIPFNVSHEVGGGTATVPGAAADSGLVGVCDVKLQCTGFSVSAISSGTQATVSNTTVTLRGAVCIRSEEAPCGSPGSPFTGVTFTERTVDTPEASTTPLLITVKVCVWLMAPQDVPTTCLFPRIDESVVTPDVGNPIGGLPEHLGLTF